MGGKAIFGGGRVGGWLRSHGVGGGWGGRREYRRGRRRNVRSTRLRRVSVGHELFVFSVPAIDRSDPVVALVPFATFRARIVAVK